MAAIPFDPFRPPERFPELEHVAFGLRFANVLMPASGTFGYGEEFAELYDLRWLGALVTKATTGGPRLGNGTPRVAETPSGMLNAIGLENPGVEAVVREVLPAARRHGVPIIVNVAGSTEEEYVAVVRALAASPDVAAIELNVSCPNVKAGGMEFGTDARTLFRLTEKVKAESRVPVIVKLSPNVTDIVALARAAEAGGADGLSLINTVVGLSIDVGRRRPLLWNTTGGLSGPAIRPIALRMVYVVYPHVSIPIIGVGGIETADDVLAFILAGAELVQVGTANFRDPYVLPRLAAALPERLRALGVRHIHDLLGAAHPPAVRDEKAERRAVR
ncbi:dihydroorotate dehydrogenase [Hydrogenibacillus sp. N12]|uniref:dihydroorotate dehydrogenase n=1 Tax=Hydrogenibacillus sp. N12 TaxID=2866627 RepID=UPI001C7D8324|nr:dihydroorotate dehydrogenase [Hydrogenibacillus sp. N12]QZA33972.1 dihydroorotate dehydrogenase [Hydrogenibacillus sp. N12]